MTVEVNDAETCRVWPEPATGACEGLDLAAASRMHEQATMGDTGAVVVRGIAVIRRLPNNHVLVAFDHSNAAGRSANTADVRQLAKAISNGATERIGTVAEVRARAPLGPYAYMEYPTVAAEKRMTVRAFAFFGDPDIGFVQLATIGDNHAGHVLANELLHTMKLARRYRAKRATHNVSELAVDVAIYGLIAVIALVYVLYERRRRQKKA